MISANESEIHGMAKFQLYNSLRTKSNVKNCNMEHHLTTVIPDIYLFINNIQVAIEIQKSDIDIKLIKHRMSEYTKKGIYVVWILPYKDPKDFIANVNNEYVLKDWQHYLQMMYFGRLYFWVGLDDVIFPYHVGKNKLQNGRMVKLSQDFFPKEGKYFKSKNNFEFNESKLYLDNQKNWWY